MNEVVIEVQPRSAVGSAASRRLRRADLVPAVLYSGDRDSVAIQVPRKVLLDLFKQGGHENRIFMLALAGTDQRRHAMIRELTLDPLTNQVTHVDFQRILMDRKIRVRVHLELEGTPVGVKTDGGILDFVTRELEIECLPGNIPHEIKVDVSGLHINEHLEARQVTLPDGVTLLGDADRVIASVSHARIEEAPVAAAPAAEAPASA